MLLMLRSFAALAVRGERWEPAALILRNPLMAEILGRRSLHAALLTLDDIEKNYLPGSLSRVVEQCERLKAEASAEKPDEGAIKLSAMLAWCAGWRDRFLPGISAEALGAWVAEMRKGRVDDGAEGQLLDALAEAVPYLRRLEERGLLEGPGEALELALASLDSLRSASGREDAVLDLLGWLELSYAPGSRMVLAGMHEGSVPDSSFDDSFLPEKVRKELGLRDAGTRYSRDAYLFHSHAASHELDVIVAKVDATGEPRSPSRLLLTAEGAELAKRVIALAATPNEALGRSSSRGR
jgi:hypothetical protein